MVTTLYRIIKYGVQGFFRNGWSSIPALSVMTLVLFVFLNLIIFNVLADSALAILRDKIDISVYFQTNVSEDDILKVQRSLASLSEVKDVEYISRDLALQSFKDRHKEDQTINQALEVLGENPLSASLNIKAKDPRDYPVIVSYLNNENLNNLVDQVTYSQNQLIINRLANIAETAGKGGVALTVILSVIAVFVTLNTIILTIYSTRDEIGVMRLVGAANKFISGPYIIQGVLYGILAAFLSMLLMVPLISVAAPYVKVLMPEVNINGYFYSNLLKLTGYQLGFGVVLGTVSSIIAVRRYLKI
ncbi:MAG: ABC transporter permease [Candidatus Harrisonbacteria bacterium]|nr:ABC transporter permease [Candidatus Harrisonbacteria bacterium]